MALAGSWGITPAFAQAARIDSISPAAARPGDQVTIRGNGFGGRNVVVSVGAAAAQVLDATGNVATFLVPATAPAGPTLVTATNPGGQSTSIAFTVQPLFTGAVVVSIDESRQVSALIGPQGGQVSTTTAGGASLTLTLPAGALAGQEQISVSPVAAIEGLPLSGGLLAAAQFAPEGLLLFKPATLTIQLPPGASAQGAVGFAYQSSGANFHLSPMSRSAGTLTLVVTHFSGAGAGTGTASNVNAIATAPQTQLEAHYLNRMVQAEANLTTQICGPSGLCSEDEQLQALAEAVKQSWTDLLSEWFGTGLRPVLAQAAASSEALGAAKREFYIWQAQVSQRLCFASDCPAPLPGYVEEGREAIGAGYLAEIRRAGAACDDTKLAKLVAEVQLNALEDYGGLPGEASDLINTYSCALVIEVVGGFPSQIDVGEAVPFSVKLSRHQENQLIPVANTGVQLAASGCGFLGGGSSSVTGITDGGGVFTTQVTGSALCGGQEQVVIRAEVETATDSPGSGNVLYFGKTAQFSATVKVGVAVSPPSVTLSPGQTQQFTAVVTGAVNTGVTWSVTGGGSVNQAGLYTAGSTGGTVKASSVADPSKSGNATVEVTVSQGGVIFLARRTTIDAHAKISLEAIPDSTVEVRDVRTHTDSAPFEAEATADVVLSSASSLNLSRQMSRLNFDVGGAKVTSVDFDGSVVDSSSQTRSLEVGTGQVSEASGYNYFFFDFIVEDQPVNYRIEGSLGVSASVAGEGILSQFPKGEALLRFSSSSGHIIDRLLILTTNQDNQGPSSLHFDISESGTLPPGRYKLLIQFIGYGQARGSVEGSRYSGSASARGAIRLTFGSAAGQP